MRRARWMGRAAAAAAAGLTLPVLIAGPAMAATYSGTKACGGAHTPSLTATTNGNATFYPPGVSQPTLFSDSTPTSHTVYGTASGGAWKVSAASVTGLTSGCPGMSVPTS